MLDLTTSDMILCHNLLMDDARFWEGVAASREGHPAKARAEDRRNLATKFKEEAELKDKETAATLGIESA